MKIGVCIRAKDEIIIKDFIKYYLDIGFDKIFIYDNMSNPPIKETNDKVEIILDPNPYSNQPVIYQECLNNNKDLDWLLLCDADEFIYIKNGTIKDFLSQFSQDTCTILINWVVFGTSNLGNYDHSKTVFQQFTKREEYCNYWNSFVKSFVRPKLIENMGNVHITTGNYKIKNVYNQEIHGNWDNCDFKDPYLSDDTSVVIVHYMLLDFENMLKKRERNIKGWILHDHNKYSMEWYHQQNFKENVEDLRMINF